jgi:hypothetical protein
MKWVTREGEGGPGGLPLAHQEAAGLSAIAEVFRHLGYKDDPEVLAAESVVYDALYAYCQEMVRRGKPDGQFR